MQQPTLSTDLPLSSTHEVETEENAFAECDVEADQVRVSPRVSPRVLFEINTEPVRTVRNNIWARRSMPKSVNRESRHRIEYSDCK